MKTKYAIIGQGLAGSFVAAQLEKRGLSYVVINDEEDCSSSEVAAGVFNPLTGPKVVKTYLADEIFPYSKLFFEEEEKRLGQKFIKETTVLKIFGSQEQQTDVLAKAEERYKDYIDTNPNTQLYSNKIQDKFGTINILKSGAIDTKAYIHSVRKFLKKKDKYSCKKIANDDFVYDNQKLNIKDIDAEHYIFCQGYHATENDLFSWLPFHPTKGEMILIEADLPEQYIINKNCFILPKGNGQFLVGASFSHKYDKELSKEGRDFLIKKLDDILSVNYKIIEQRVGIRPTVKDRKPYLGRHPEYSNIYILNGFGSKGVTLGPYFACHLIDFIEKDISLYKEVDINRYKKV